MICEANVVLIFLDGLARACEYLLAMTNTTCTASAPAALTVGSLVTLNGDTYRVESIDRPAAVAAELERSGFDGNNYLASRVLKPGQRAARVALFSRSAATGAPTVALLRADKAIDARFTADSDIYGGFSFREPGHEACDKASRCIHVIVSRDGGRYKVAHAIVDLQTARVIDPNYDPDLGGVLETPLKAANQ